MASSNVCDENQSTDVANADDKIAPGTLLPIGTFNCQTICNLTKFSSVMAYCMRSNCGIVALQETHADFTEENYSNYQVFWCSRSVSAGAEPWSRLIEKLKLRIAVIGNKDFDTFNREMLNKDSGLAFFVRKNANVEVLGVERLHSRFALLRFKYNGAEVILVNTYSKAYNGSYTLNISRRCFLILGEIYRTLKGLNNTIIIICGDMNATVHLASDGSLEPHIMEHVFRESTANNHFPALYEFLLRNDLRLLNSRFNIEQDQKWTCLNNRGTKAELDYFISDRSDLVKKVAVYPSERDHSMVISKWKIVAESGVRNSIVKLQSSAAISQQKATEGVFTLKLLIEKCSQFNQPIYLASIKFNRSCDDLELEDIGKECDRTIAETNGINVKGEYIRRLIVNGSVVLIGFTAGHIQEHLVEFAKICNEHDVTVDPKKIFFTRNRSTRKLGDLTFANRVYTVKNPQDSRHFLYQQCWIDAKEDSGLEIEMRIAQAKKKIENAQAEKKIEGVAPISREEFEQTLFSSLFYCCETWRVSKSQYDILKSVVAELARKCGLGEVYDFNVMKYVLKKKAEWVRSLVGMKESWAYKLIGWRPEAGKQKKHFAQGSRWCHDLLVALNQSSFENVKDSSEQTLMVNAEKHIDLLDAFIAA